MSMSYMGNLFDALLLGIYQRSLTAVMSCSLNKLYLCTKNIMEPLLKLIAF